VSESLPPRISNQKMKTTSPTNVNVDRPSEAAREHANETQRTS